MTDSMVLRLSPELVSMLDSDVMQADASGVIDDEVVKALVATGVFDTLAHSFSATQTVVGRARLMAQHHPSAAWNMVVSTTSELMARRFLLHTNQALTWADDALWAGVFSNFASVAHPNQRSSKQGFQTDALEGAWPYASNSHWAQWAILNVAHTELGPCFILVSREDFTIERTWNVMGLRATRSDTIHVRVEDMPRECFLPAAKLFQDPPAAQHSMKLPPRLLTAFGLAAVALGAAQSLIDFFVAQTREAAAKAVNAAPGAPNRGATQAGLASTLAAAAAEVEGAQLTLEHQALRLDEAAVAQGAVPTTVLTEARLGIGKVVRDIADAIHELSLIGGSRWTLEGSVAGRAWRDAHVACRHAALSPAVGFELGGQYLINPEAADRTAVAGPLAPSVGQVNQTPR